MNYFETAKAITRAAFPNNAKDAMIEDYSREFPLLTLATRNLIEDTRKAATEEGSHEGLQRKSISETPGS